MRKNDVANRMNLQLFAEPAPAPAEPATGAPATPSPSGSASASPEAIASAVMAAIESRQKRAEGGVVKSMAEQYGMQEEELTQLLEQERQRRATQLPPEQQRIVDEQLARANGLLIAADVRTTGAAMGLVDADAALLLLDRTNVKVDEKGAVTGVKEALEALKTAKPYLFANANPTPKIVGPTPGVDPGTNDVAAARAVMGLPPEK